MRSFPSYDRDPRPPRMLPPPGACDSQIHVYGPAVLYPPRKGTAYDPPDATFADARRMHDTLGIVRGVIVQATCYGVDHRLMLDALAQGGGQYRGCAIIDDTVSDAELRRLHEAGVRGARFNFARVLNISISSDLFRRSIERIKPLGWFAKIFTMGDELLERSELFTDLDLPVVLDHMGGVEIRNGLQQPLLTLILDLLTRENWWIMLSSGDRHSRTGFPWDDVIELGQRLIAAAPSRAIWATDWPHVIYEGKMPNDGDLLDLFYRYAPDRETQKRILVDNPARLFGFQPT